MFDQIKNRQGEKLYILTISNTNSIKPYTYVNTWEVCINKFKEATTEMDNDNFFAQVIHKKLMKKHIQQRHQWNVIQRVGVVIISIT